MMYPILLVICLCWGVVFFMDTIFKSCMFVPYLKALERTGITIKPFVILWVITSFNRSFRTLGRYWPSFMRKWFDLGALFACLCMLPSIGLFFISFYHIFHGKSPEDYNNQLLVPVIPGYNIPFSHLLYYLIVIFVCSLVHELGHAIAASREKITIESCGVGVYAIFPVAFIHLYKEQLRQLSLWQQLRIFSAGIWHNILLSCLALGLILSNPFILSPLYQKNNGITVLHVNENSGVAGPGGLIMGDQIFSISDCNVHDSDAWTKCLGTKMQSLQSGFCVTTSYILKEDIAKNDANSVDCCGNSTAHLCFSYMDLKSQKEVCLHARDVIEKFKTCSKSADCIGDSWCLTPVLLSKSDRFVEIKRKGKSSVLYIGSLNELSSAVAVSSWVSKFSRISVDFVEMLETFLTYIIIFSGGLAVLNVIPCYALDGECICENVIHLCLTKYIPNYSYRALIIKFLHISGLFIIIMSAFITFYKIYEFSF